MANSTGSDIPSDMQYRTGSNSDQKPFLMPPVTHSVSAGPLGPVP